MQAKQTKIEQVPTGGSSTLPKVQLKPHLLQEIFPQFSQAEFLSPLHNPLFALRL